VVDVRSHPISRAHPQFNKDVLAADLKKAKIVYVFLGKELGARRVESSCYIDGRADYGRIAALPIFQEGLRRIREGLLRYRIALMCAEQDPLDCHRGILICRHLRNEGISIRHIREDGSLEPQKVLEKRLVDRLEIEPNLFNGGRAFEKLIEKAFETRGKKIAYVQRRPGGTDRRY
jgi:uncharacterized protein (DUF488 family)